MVSELPVLDLSLLPSDLVGAAEAAHSQSDVGIFRHPFGEGLVVTRFTALRELMKLPAVQAQRRDARASGPSAGGELAAMFNAHPVFMNEPQHRPTRMAVAKPIGPAATEWLQQPITALCEALCDQMLHAGAADLVNDYAFALSSQLWCRLVGIPESDAGHLCRLALRLSGPLAFEPTPEMLQDANDAALEILHITRAALAENGTAARPLASAVRGELAAAAREDLPETTDLIAALTFDAVDGAGGMTANALHCLLSHPSQLATVRENPELAGEAWLESARLCPSLLGLFRCPQEDIDYGGVTLPKGTNVLMLNAFGNRDPLVYERPHEFLIDREEKRVMSFGFGARGCIGRHLAKLQGEIAIAVLLQKCGEQLRCDAPEPDWGARGLLRAVQRIPVSLQ